MLLKLRRHIRPGHIAPFAAHIAAFVEAFGEYLHAEVGHSYFVCIREAEAHPKVGFIRIGDFGREFPADISSRLFHLFKQFTVFFVIHQISFSLRYKPV